MTLLSEVRRLDIGSGLLPIEGYVGIDCCTVPAELAGRVIAFDVCSGQPWPFEDGQMEALAAHHFIEHIPAAYIDTYEHASTAFERSPRPTRFVRKKGVQDALCWVMDECYRIAAPGCRFELSWPAMKDARTGEWLIAPYWDPTHRRFIPPEQIDFYFNREGREHLKVQHYAIACDWRVKQALQRSRGTLIENYYVLEKPRD